MVVLPVYDPGAYNLGTKVLARFHQPRYAGCWQGQACSLVATPAGEDLLQLQLKWSADTAIQACFLAHGSPATIACADWLCEWVTGKTAAELTTLTGRQIAQALELDNGDWYSALLAEDVLQQALVLSPHPDQSQTQASTTVIDQE